MAPRPPLSPLFPYTTLFRSVCTRCEKAMTWIGIGPGAEPICLTSCEPVLPGTRCPNCKSFNIQVFEMHVGWGWMGRSEEHTSELQSRRDLVCRLLLEKKKKT